jgi:phosphoglucomutase
MITASHNPWHDNGFKAYFSDGAQMVDPHAAGVIAEFAKVSIDEICKFWQKDLSGVVILGSDTDSCYQSYLNETILRRNVLKENPVRVAFSPLHGTGGIASIPALAANGIGCDVVTEQNDGDPNFSTVKSPNPENEEALRMVIALGKKVGADIVLATDPDGDRLAVAARNGGGEFEIFTGNVMGSLFAEYRILQLKCTGQIPAKGSTKVAIIKTFVTTPLIDKIASAHGVKCINTLTGFKWIGEKMLDYEIEMLAKEYQSTGISVNYDGTATEARRKLLLKNSTLFAFGCEESYGCLFSDVVRDKDANAACLMACELAAHAKSLGKTIPDLRDDMYVKYGYFGESVLNIYYDGVDGVQKIENILNSYQKNPPRSVNGSKVERIIDFSRQKIVDPDGKLIPSQQFLLITLESGVRFAVRASGTEPKIKFYLFGEAKISDRSQLAEAKTSMSTILDETKKLLGEDADRRANFTT